MKLIREYDENVEVLTEEYNGEKRLYIKGPFIQTEIANKNRRIYPLKNVINEINRYKEEVIKTNGGVGELGHPPTPTINYERSCIKILSLEQDGNDFIGKALVLKTPMGQIVESLHKDGVRLGVSSRGLGSVKKNKDGLDEVQEDYRLSTPADVVASPSAPNAYVQGIMENVEYWWDAAKGTYVEQHLDDVKKHIKKLSIQEIEEQKYLLFAQYLDGLIKK